MSNVSRAKVLINNLNWAHKPSVSGQTIVRVCPYCGNTNFKFYINTSGGDSDGLFDCKVCGVEGNLFKLREHLGVVLNNVVSVKEAVVAEAPPLPNLESAHNTLINDEEIGGAVLDYLVTERGISMEVVEQFKLGAWSRHNKLWAVIPYYHQGNLVYYKARTIAGQKEFDAPAGREAALFNEDCLTADIDTLLIVEGEMDALTLLSHGYQKVVAVPGASMKKASWIQRLDLMAPKKIVLVYDNDKPGQTGAYNLAVRIGLDKVHNLVLPPFKRKDGELGKDINEYFCAGHTAEEFDSFVQGASQFGVDGVADLSQLLDELRDELETKGTDPTYDTPWPSLTSKIGGAEDGDLIGVMAEGKVGKTTVCLNWLQYYADKGIDSMMFCQEMQPRRLVRKWVSMVTRTPDTPGKSQLTGSTIDSAFNIAAQMPGDLLFGYTRTSNPKEVFETIRQAVRRYGVKVVCFDNLQLLVRSTEHSASETSKLTKEFKALAMELKIVILLVIQPHRVPDGQIVSARNAMGSSAIEKDVDTMICLHRNRVADLRREQDFSGFMETDENFEPHMLVRADLTRYAPGGKTTLYMDGATSSVVEITPDLLSTLNAVQNVQEVAL